jgi:HSP20 family protein
MNDVAVREPFALLDWVPRFLDTDWGTSHMRVEEYREGDTLVVKAEMPGIDPDKDVKISLTEGRLRVRAERHQVSEHKEKDNYRSEFHYGSYLRDFVVPAGVKEQDIKASYKDGVLMIRVPLPNVESHSAIIPITHE